MSSEIWMICRYGYSGSSEIQALFSTAAKAGEFLVMLKRVNPDVPDRDWQIMPNMLDPETEDQARWWDNLSQQLDKHSLSKRQENDGTTL